MSFEESIETNKDSFCSGLLSPGQLLLFNVLFDLTPHYFRFRSCRSGTIPRPGEFLFLTMVLFLDELPEFARNVLEVMRQPLEIPK